MFIVTVRMVALGGLFNVSLVAVGFHLLGGQLQALESPNPQVPAGVGSAAAGNDTDPPCWSKAGCDLNTQGKMGTVSVTRCQTGLEWNLW